MIHPETTEHLPEVRPVSSDALPPEQATQLQQALETHTRNREWFQSRADELIRRHAGRFVCVAGGEEFAAATAQEAFRLARAAHPEEDLGVFGVRIPIAKIEGVR